MTLRGRRCSSVSCLRAPSSILQPAPFCVAYVHHSQKTCSWGQPNNFEKSQQEALWWTGLWCLPAASPSALRNRPYAAWPWINIKSSNRWQIYFFLKFLLVLDPSDAWQFLTPCPSCIGAVPPARVLRQIVHAVSQEVDSTLLVSFEVTRGLVSVHPPPAFDPALTPATQNKCQLSLAAHAHAARSTTWALWLRLGVNTTQLNYFSLQRTTNPPPPHTPPPLFLYINRFACTFTPLFSLLFIFRSPCLIRGSWCRTQA